MSTAEPPTQVLSTATQIAQALGESARLPQAQIRRIIQTCGAEQAQTWLEETLTLAEHGGLATADGSRPRTRGGIFFRLVRDALRASGHMDQIDQIFRYRQPRGGQRGAAPAKRKAPAPNPPQPPATWAERGARIAASGPEIGKVTKVKVTLIGRPGKVVERPDFTLLQMKHSGGLPALPKGIPVPSQPPETTYVVYIGAKQWRGVAEAIKQPDDILIVEGTQFYDKEFEAIAVFATNTTTRALQQAKRASGA